MNNATSDVRIDSIVAMQSPAELFVELPLHIDHAGIITQTRRDIADIIHGRNSRQLVVIGPCSIHDPVAALEYAHKLQVLREQYSDSLEIVMRVYFEKPRTTIGWKGLINDPHMDNSFQIDEGLFMARKLLLDLAQMHMPAGCEFLDAVTGQYYADTVSWGAIGARTTESQVHREIASGLSCPVGFKNATSGDVGIAIDAIQAASHPHAFLSPTEEGRIALFKTKGNEDAHLILRGGPTPNYDSQSLRDAYDRQVAQGFNQRIMIDCSHANSQKDHKRQIEVVTDVAARLSSEASMIAGVMIESHLVEGKQSIGSPESLNYGQSITDACLGWEDTERTLEILAEASSRLQH
ncbi:3-deoxy-7-phosphoheptulonate synthase [Granulosicoccus antarcticus]|uniref:Phospho-2-dehydro-3-deoxyheptonate aldolase n=1 Tax=Granulosicoccus antarcticus IMCC3135 TaxID=1192854 RepID=A0A2Z2P2N6_9GAMM|nr:3-deoxy-7-phosphoheptulonate synthase [Granulosicoccus antarcticus]ASJ75620.1 Phospho-2-dehydro-3-deoxyheptonate aldolase, Phe-sensitive [Granulosicoccus antarcticus IMCC3135]